MRYLAGALGLMLATAGCAKKEEAEAGATPPAITEETTPASEPKSAAAPAAQMPANALPGAQDVRDAMTRKEYSGAVERYIALRGLAHGDDKWAEYRQLGAEIGEQLSEAAKTDPAALPALDKYRTYMFGNR